MRFLRHAILLPVAFAASFFSTAAQAADCKPLHIVNTVKLESADGGTTAFRLGERENLVCFTKQKATRWSMYGWIRESILADDGDRLLVLFPSLNLIPVDYDVHNPYLILLHRGEIVQTTSVIDVVKKKSNLRRTVSHFEVGSTLGVDERGRFRVRTADGNIFFMDLKTGDTGILPADNREKADHVL